MEMEGKETQPTESGRKIVAVAGDRTIEIEPDRLMAPTTRMRVNAKQGTFFSSQGSRRRIG